ncbi:hypothetical protein H6P81_000902 [Aristolochia fimbriata]|uniref:glucan endo-1,3-beta-D-glucosidase n=1 Tax=Aristolochia fimbriata TaxID=158543 RepID=A0AAV7F6W1_ARIFI|nr:hypothetical protein H6P81_000902 [Aristolochia fimbriata]
MRGRSYSYSPSPPRGYGRRGRSPSPRGRYGGRGRDAPTSLLVRNLRHDCRGEDLRRPFGQFGPLKDIYLPRDYYTREPRGFGFVQFVDPADAAEAKYQMDGQILMGRELTVVFAEENRKKPSDMRARERVRGRARGGRRSPRYSRSPPPRYRSRSRSPSYYSPSLRRRHYSRSISPLADYERRKYLLVWKPSLKLLGGRMSPGKWRINVIFMMIFLFSCVSGTFIGMNIGMDMSNLPSATAVVEILKAQKVTHVRLFDADHRMLFAFANTGIEVMVGVPNDELLGIGQSQAKAAEWVNHNVGTFLPATNITAIAVGSEVLTSIPNAALVLVPAIKNIQSALVASNINYQIKISTPLPMDMIPKPFPPSTATFNSTWNDIMKQLLQFLKNTDSYLMLNVHPYYGYVQGNGIFPIEYALFRSLPSSKQIVDANTLLHYNSMFDSMVDAAYYSMEALNFSGIPVLVTESGWPWSGGANEPDANEDNAQEYNSHLIQRVLNGTGTPSQPDIPISVYIYELFNEDLRPGPISEKNWGVFFTNGSAVYSLSLGSGISQNNGNSSTGVGFFCVANSNATSDALLTGLNWACGAGNANCSAIQEGQPCYDPNTVDNHASYAYNDYYHRTVATGGTCDFGGTGMITSNDPSYGSCIFSGSLKSNSSSGGSFNPLAPSDSFPSGASVTSVCKFLIVIPAMILFFLVERQI